MNALYTALELNARNIAVLPIRPMSKLPAIDSWKQYQDHKPEFSQLLKWFSGNDLNIAVLCGSVSNGLCILDFDSEQAYVVWMVKNPEYRHTFQVSTSRGRHLYFFCEELPEKTFKLEGIDVKSTGYCLTYGSVHPSGVPYQVINDTEIMRIENILEVVKPPSTEVSSTTPITINNYGTIGTLNVNTTITNCTRWNSRTDLIGRIKAKHRITDLFPLAKETGDGRGFAHCPMPAHPNKDRDASLSLDLVKDRCQCTRSNCPLHTQHGSDYIDAYRIVNGLTFKDALSELATELNRDYGE